MKDGRRVIGKRFKIVDKALVQNRTDWTGKRGRETNIKDVVDGKEIGDA